jgi:hypothetical protein
MPIIRPEAMAILRRWAEVLAALSLVALGLLGLGSRDPFLRGLAGLLVAGGLGLTLVGWRRMRFATSTAGAGIVQVVEGQIAYFGPENGGFLGVQDIVELHLTAGGADWLLIGQDDTRLQIPTGAEGAGALFDVFTALPGLQMGALLAARDAARADNMPRALWMHPSRQGRHLRLT